MIIPISTDAPIYYWPWMTLVLIGVNVVTFLATGFGLHVDGWQISYGHGLHPVEWLTYSFIHYDWVHLVGNMFFLWGFGIVVEGKLGWWKYLLLYLGIGLIGGVIIQLMMLGFVDPREKLKEINQQVEQRQKEQPQVPPGQQLPAEQPVPVDPQPATPQPMQQSMSMGVLATLFQDDDFPDGDDGDMPLNPGMKPDDGEPDFDDVDLSVILFRTPGAAGASLVIYALLAITLVWAPKNEVTCFVLRIPPGTFEIEYIYFCGFRVVTQILYASLYGFQMSSELGHAVGAIAGLGVGTLFVKQNWVDCENWDLFAVMKGTHGNRANIGGWCEREGAAIATPIDSDSPNQKTKKKKTSFRANIYDSPDPSTKSTSKAKSGDKRAKSVEPDEESADDALDLEGWDDFSDPTADESEEVEALEIFENDEEFDIPAPAPESKQKTPAKAKSKDTLTTPKPAAKTSTEDRLRAALESGQAADALKLYRKQKSAASNWSLGEVELTSLCNGLHKAELWSDVVPLMQECVTRFPQTVRIRLKLAAIFAEIQRRPRAALKLLAQIPRDQVSEKLRPNYDKIRKLSQKLIEMGIDDRES